MSVSQEEKRRFIRFGNLSSQQAQHYQRPHRIVVIIALVLWKRIWTNRIKSVVESKFIISIFWGWLCERIMKCWWRRVKKKKSKISFFLDIIMLRWYVLFVHIRKFYNIKEEVSKVFGFRVGINGSKSCCWVVQLNVCKKQTNKSRFIFLADR